VVPGVSGLGATVYDLERRENRRVRDFGSARELAMAQNVAQPIAVDSVEGGQRLPRLSAG
jgi:hypothetical protein